MKTLEDFGLILSAVVIASILIISGTLDRS